MHTERFYDGIIRRAPFRDRAQAERAVGIVLDELAELLAGPELAAIAGELPERLAAQLKVDHDVKPTASGFLQKVAAEEHSNLGFAKEHAGVILQALFAELSAETASRIKAALPSEIARMAEPREPAQSPPQPDHARREPKHSIASGTPRGRSLATGRPGSRHPVSEAHPERAHRDSVARSERPHADTQLSTGAPSPDKK